MPSWIVDVNITDPSRASTPTQGPSTTPLPTNPRSLNLLFLPCEMRSDPAAGLHETVGAMRDLYDSTSRRQAERELVDWHRWATVHDVEETNRFAGTLRRREHEILAYFDTGLTNGPTEGTNLIIKQVKRQGFGYTNPHNYRLRVLYRCA